MVLSTKSLSLVEHGRTAFEIELHENQWFHVGNDFLWACFSYWKCNFVGKYFESGKDFKNQVVQWSRRCNGFFWKHLSNFLPYRICRQQECLNFPAQLPILSLLLLCEQVTMKVSTFCPADPIEEWSFWSCQYKFYVKVRLLLALILRVEQGLEGK